MQAAVATTYLPLGHRNCQHVWCASGSEELTVAVVVRGIMVEGGDVAARVACDGIRRGLASEEAHSVRWPTPEHGLRATLAVAVRVAHERLLRGTSEMGREMAASLVVLLAGGSHVAIAHVGDCRAYRWRAGRLEGLTQDHTLRAAYDRSGQTYDPGLVLEGIVTRALGGLSDADNDEPKADFRVESHAPRDTLVLCSGGLPAIMNDHEIAASLNGAETAEDCCAALRAAVLERRGDHEVSLVAVRIGIEDDVAPL